MWKRRTTFNFSPCDRYCLLIGWQLTTWSHVTGYEFTGYTLSSSIENFSASQPSLARLYSAAASPSERLPSERLRSDASLAINTNELPNHFTLTVFWSRFFGVEGAIYYEAKATVIFPHVKISSFRAKAHLVFYWCLYNKNTYQDERYIWEIWIHSKQDKIGKKDNCHRCTQREYSSKPVKHSIVKRILVFKR